MNKPKVAILTGLDCVIIGNKSGCDHNNCVLIGNGLQSTKDNQIIIGHSEVSVSRDMTDDEYKELRHILLQNLVTD